MFLWPMTHSVPDKGVPLGPFTYKVMAGSDSLPFFFTLQLFSFPSYLSSCCGRAISSLLVPPTARSVPQFIHSFPLTFRLRRPFFPLSSLDGPDLHSTFPLTSIFPGSHLRFPTRSRTFV